MLVHGWEDFPKELGVQHTRTWHTQLLLGAGCRRSRILTSAADHAPKRLLYYWYSQQCIFAHALSNLVVDFVPCSLSFGMFRCCTIAPVRAQTTVLALTYDGGVLLAADSRTSQGKTTWSLVHVSGDSRRRLLRANLDQTLTVGQLQSLPCH